MKKIISFIITICIMLSFSICAFADVAYEPSDSFYKSHERECSYYNTFCYANSENGYITVWKDPTAKKGIGNPVNGTIIYCSYEYEGWYYVEYNEQNSVIVGWALSSDFVETYTGVSFLNEYSSHMLTDNDELSEEFMARVATNDQYFFYTYPGSGEISSSILSECINEESYFYFSDVYEDDQGNLWGYVSYFMGNRDSWICISDPENNNLPKTLDKTPQLYPAKEIESGTTPEAPSEAVKSSTTNVVISVIATCCILITFISISSKKRTQEARAKMKAASKKKKKKK